MLEVAVDVVCYIARVLANLVWDGGELISQIVAGETYNIEEYLVVGGHGEGDAVDYVEVQKLEGEISRLES